MRLRREGSWRPSKYLPRSKGVAASKPLYCLFLSDELHISTSITRWLVVVSIQSSGSIGGAEGTCASKSKGGALGTTSLSSSNGGADGPS